MKHLFQPQWYETRKQLQESNCKKHKHVEYEQHATKQSMSHWRTQRGNQKIPGDKWKWKHNDPESMECSKNISKREIYSNTCLPQETRKISNKQSNLTPKGTRKRTKPKVSRTKEIIKIRVEVNEIESKKQ